jgi:neutral ceramidase
LGFIAETYNAIVNGITQSIVSAHNSMFNGRVFISETEVSNAGVNRSPKAYINNPQAERSRFREDVDRTMTQIRFVNSANQLMGAFSWLAVHSTSMNNTNQLVSSDNFGYASIQLEAEYNPKDLVGQGTFIGAFCSAHSADISPNILGPRCQVCWKFDALTILTQIEKTFRAPVRTAMV